MSFPKHVLTFLCTLHLLAARAQDGFQLTGTAPASLEGSMIYIGTMDYSGNNQHFRDSATIRQGRFSFTGHLPQTTMLTSLTIRQPGLGICQFFLENRPITLTIHSTTAKNHLDSCTFTNAPIQDQFIRLKKKQKPVEQLIGRQYQKMDTAMLQASEPEKQKMNKELTDLFHQNKQVIVDFIRDNPNDLLSLYQLCYFIAGGPMEYPDSLQHLLSGLARPLQQQPEAIALQKRIQQARATGKGQPVLWTVQSTGQNKPIHLTAYKGKYLLLDFWASWCGPCLQKLPNLKDLYNTYKGNIEVIGISLDEDRSQWLNAIKKYAIPGVQVSDLRGWKNAVAQLYDIKAIPQYILVDPTGKIMTNSNDIATIKQQLERSLNPTTLKK